MLKEILKKLPKQVLKQRKYKVIIVDDNQNNVELMKQQLEEAGYETVSCSSGNQVLDVASQENPDLVLLDIMMPNLNGYQTCALLKEKFKDKFLPVILISVKEEAESKVKGLSSGADDYIIKPYDFQELKLRVGHLIDLVKVDEVLHVMMSFYEKSQSLTNEIQVLLSSLQYALEKIDKGQNKDIQFAKKQIDTLVKKIERLGGRT